MSCCLSKAPWGRTQQSSSCEFSFDDALLAREGVARSPGNILVCTELLEMHLKEKFKTFSFRVSLG